MATDEQVNVKYMGPIATHDMPCPVYGCPNKAVLEFGTPGMFQPCWTCQQLGWRLIQLPRNRRR
jgi:hypothetical protein